MLPTGADAVVMIEHTSEATADSIEVVRPVAPGENVVRFDEDAAPGAPLARRGRPLRTTEQTGGRDQIGSPNQKGKQAGSRSWDGKGNR